MDNKNSSNDLTIDDVLRFRRLERAFLKRCRHFGYAEIRTATIQPLYIFTGSKALSDAKLQRIYSFIDWNGWSGERVALKPDSTTCVSRFYGEHLHAENPRRKLCYVENHFEWADSWDVISERWQCGVESIGSKKPESDVEVIYMASDILREIGFEKYYLYLSYPSISRAIGDDPSFVGAMGTRPEKCNANYLENLSHSLPGATYERVRPDLDNFILICRLLDKLEFEYLIDFSPLGDLEYYTGIQFQMFPARRKSSREMLCSGGRYDNFIKETWDLPDPVPAVGFALYIRNILKHPDVARGSAAAMGELQNICIYISNIARRNVSKGQMFCEIFSRIGASPQISFSPVDEEKYNLFGLVIEVDHERFEDGFQVLHSREIDKQLLVNLFGELNER
jgi:histidyl-tRNA synthetase